MQFDAGAIDLLSEPLSTQDRLSLWRGDLIRPFDAWTDYPMASLGDAPNEEAPVRRVTVIAADSKRVLVVPHEAPDHLERFKRYYVTLAPARLDEAPSVSFSKIRRRRRQMDARLARLGIRRREDRNAAALSLYESVIRRIRSRASA